VEGGGGRDEGGEAVPAELQRLVDETSRAVRRAQPTKDAVAPSSIRHSPSSPLHPPSPLPDLILIDGGKGQLSAACGELEKLGLAGSPVIG